MQAKTLFALPPSLSLFKDFFDSEQAPWLWVSAIKTALASLQLEPLTLDQLPSGIDVKGNIYIHPTVKFPHFATLHGPLYIGAHTEIRNGTYIRGNVIVGEKCILGNSCEFKNCLLMDSVAAPHFNYIGDSILGSHSHLGAGVILANLRFDRKNIKVQTPDQRIETSLKKLGSFLGEYAEVGCNTVLQPGSILGKYTAVGPCLAFKGFLSENQVFLKQH